MSVIALVLAASALGGTATGYLIAQGNGAGILLVIVLSAVVPLLTYALYRRLIFPAFRRLEDANLELHLKHEELLDVKDDLFIKFLGIYDVNYAANSPRLFNDRMKDVADITARVMEADVCFIFLFDKKSDELVLEASNKDGDKGPAAPARIALGEGVEGWVGRRLDPVMLKDVRSDSRFKDVPELELSRYSSVYCLPLYVYSNGVLVGVMEVLYEKAKSFTDEEINFFTTLSGIISTTIQNELMQVELRKMNLELEQWVSEKTEELRASEERYRTLVENACESIFVLAENGDVVFANDQAARLTGHAKYDLLHKNLFELFGDSPEIKELPGEAARGRQAVRHGDLQKIDGAVIPVEVSAVGLVLMGKRFIQTVVRDMSSRQHLENLLKEKEQEIAALKTHPTR
ncbi:MAG: PAS domain S-box protein [Candidatus Omnitrophica bacterium]|nr:PAS domain S-box protein [Candidatus Omnitrophota bacterium]